MVISPIHLFKPIVMYPYIYYFVMLRLHFKLEFWIRFFSELNKERVVIILFREDFYSWSYKPSFKPSRAGNESINYGISKRDPHRQKECIEIRKNLKFGVNLFITTIGSLPHWRTDCKTRTEKGRVNRWIAWVAAGPRTRLNHLYSHKKV